MFASKNGHSTAVKALLDAGADRDLSDEVGFVFRLQFRLRTGLIYDVTSSQLNIAYWRFCL
jgi:ankyrin repeat protein